MDVTVILNKLKVPISRGFIKVLCFVAVCSMNPGDSKAMEGIQNVERANGGEVEHDSGDEADEPNGGVSLEEVLAH